MRRAALFLSCALLAHGAHAECYVPKAGDLERLNDADLKAQYCDARNQLAIGSSMAPAPLGGSPLGSSSPAGGMAAQQAARSSATAACYSQINLILKAFEKRHIDADDAIKSCR